MPIDNVNGRDFLDAEIPTVFGIHIDVCRTSAVQGKGKHGFVRFHLAIALVFLVLYHRNGDTLHRYVIGNVPAVYLLVYQMTPTL